MDWLPLRWARRLRALARRTALEREMDEEMRFHLQMEAEDLRRRHGLTAPEARRRALIAFGGVERYKEAGRHARGYARLAGLSLDLGFALRMLRKHAALTLVGGLGLAVAIAVAAGFFTFMHQFYASHPPLPEGERVVALENRNLLDDEDWRASLHDYHSWRENLRSFETLAAFRRTTRQVWVPGGIASPAPVAEMTASGFRVARVAALMGRTLLDTDEASGAQPVVVIGHREWQQEFGGDPEVVGRELRLGGRAHTVVGVMPRDFRFPLNHGYWTALPTDRSLAGPGEGPRIFVFGRLAAGVNREVAQAELAALGERTSAEIPAVYQHLRPFVLPYVHPLLDVQQYPAWLVWLLQVFGVLVLTVVAVNVAVLVYARTAARQAEITVRTALGAPRGRIVTQLFLEALALSAPAAALGLGVAQWAYRQIFAMTNLQGLPYWIGGGLSAATVPYAAALAVLTAFVVGVLPALRATGRNLQGRLRQMGGGPAFSVGATWSTLIVGQVAVAVAVLPAVVAIAADTLWRPRPEALFPAAEVLTFRLRHDADPFNPDPPAMRATFARQQEELIRRVAAEPGVAAVTWSRDLPLSGERVRMEPEEGAAGAAPTPALVSAVAPDYFEVLGVPLLAGRGFATEDLLEGAMAVIVSRTFVERVLGGGEALGRRVRETPGLGREPGLAARAFEVVGVVEDVYRYPVRPELTEAVIYLPLALGAEPVRLAARARGTAAEALAPRVREIAEEVAPDWALGAAAMADLYSGADARTRRFTTLVVGLLTGSVLLLSAAGISALMSFAVTRRQREIAVRVALGAPRERVVAAIFSRSAGQLAGGLVMGAAGAALLDRASGGALLGGRGVVLLPLVGALMAAAGLLATLGPARRALRVLPMEALRGE